MKRWAGLITLTIVIIITFTVVERNHAADPVAVMGTHGPTGNIGYLGVDIGGVSGVGVGFSDGVHGSSANGFGVYGVSSSSNSALGAGAGGSCDPCPGVRGFSNSGYGVYGITNGSGGGANGVVGKAEGNLSFATGVWGIGSAPAYAGYFSGNVTVAGTLTKSAGSFRIDHPLDPQNKYLSHSFVESDEMKNVYDGIATLDQHGEAVVEMPKWFEALNREFRYQLTCIGEHAPVFIADEIHDNQFRIAGGYEGMRVSWQVTGVRHDPYATIHPIIVEEIKPIEQRGRLLHPDVYQLPESMGIDYARISAANKIARSARQMRRY